MTEPPRVPWRHPSRRVVCDFCSSPDPMWAYIVEPHRASLGRNAASTEYVREDAGDGWTACERCAEYIERGDRAGLALHASAQFAGRGRRIPRNAIVSAHEPFWANHTGERRPYG